MNNLFEVSRRGLFEINCDIYIHYSIAALGIKMENFEIADEKINELDVMMDGDDLVLVEEGLMLVHTIGISDPHGIMNVGCSRWNVHV